jgi:hypothetical protein
MRPLIIATAIGAANPWTAFEIAVFSGDVSAIERTIANLDLASRLYARRVANAASTDVSLRQFAQSALSTPRDLGTVGWCARLAALRGSGAIRATCLEVLDIADASQRHAYGDVARIHTDSASIVTEDWASGGTYRYYGLYLYRRPIPTQWLVPGLPRVDLVGLP